MMDVVWIGTWWEQSLFSKEAQEGEYQNHTVGILLLHSILECDIRSSHV